MPSQKYALTPGGPKRLEISKRAFSPKRIVLLDGKEIGVIASDGELQRGWSLTSKNGTTLSITTGSAWGTPYDIRLNGVPLPNTAGDPQSPINTAVGVLGFITVVNVAAGLIASNLGEGFLGIDQETGILVLITGVLYGIVTVFVWRRSLVALGIAIIGYTIDTLGILLTYGGLFGLGIGGILLRPVFLYLLIRAINPMRKLRQQQKIAPAPHQPLTKVEMGLLLAAIVMVGVVIIGGVLSNATLRKVVYVAANLPLTPTQTPRPSETSLPTITPTPSRTPVPVAQADMSEVVQYFPVSYLNISGTYYSPALDIFIFIASRGVLHIFDPETGGDVEIPLVDDVSAFALSPSGKFAVVGHEGKISYVDLVNARVSKILDVKLSEVEELLFPDEAWIYAFERLNGDLHRLNLENNLETIIQAANFSVSPASVLYSEDYKIIYMAGTDGTGNDEILRMDVSDPQSPIIAKWESPSYGRPVTAMEISWDKKYGYANNLLALKLPSQPDDDLVQQGVFRSDELREESNWRNLYSLGPNWVARMKDDGSIPLYQTGNWTSEDQFQPKMTVLPPLMRGLPKIKGVVQYRRIFVNATGTRYYITFGFNSDATYNNYGFIVRDVPPPST